MDIQQKITNRLLEIMNEKNINQKKLSENCKIPYTTVNGWFTKRQRPTIDWLDKISKYYKISIDYLIGNENDYGIIEITQNITTEEKQILKLYQQLDNKQKGKAEGYISAMIEENKYKTKEG